MIPSRELSRGSTTFVRRGKEKKNRVECCVRLCRIIMWNSCCYLQFHLTCHLCIHKNNSYRDNGIVEWNSSWLSSLITFHILISLVRYYVERKQAFPDLPLPDPQWLRKDYETCVLRGDPECTYREGETHEGIGDHRRQTLFFCGHDDDCT